MEMERNIPFQILKKTNSGRLKNKDWNPFWNFSPLSKGNVKTPINVDPIPVAKFTVPYKGRPKNTSSVKSEKKWSSRFDL